MEIAAVAVALRSASTGEAVSIAVQRIGIEAERQVASLVENVAEAAKAPAGPGLGALLDRLA